jgi:DNA-directed RNA polymerase specialized sigma24 family protein
VAEKALGARSPADAKLLEQVRAGDTSAFGVLYERHVHSVRRLARELVLSPAEADHLVAETFGLVHDVIQAGGGPDDAFRPYLLATLRRVFAGQVGDRRAPSPGDPGPGEPLTDSPADACVARGFLFLPERTRTVLWHTDIEQGAAADVAPILGTSAHAVASLRRRARDSLRQAVLDSHGASPSGPDCGTTAEQIGDYQRGALSASQSYAVADHLRQCDDCSAVVVALGDLTNALQHQVAPLYLGGATAAYLVGARLGDAAAPAAPAVASGGDTRELPAVASAEPGRPTRRGWIAAGAALAIVAVAVALTLTGRASPPRTASDSRSDAVPSVSAGGGGVSTPQPTRSAASARPSAPPSRSATPRSSASTLGAPESAPPSPKSTGTPRPSPSPTPGVTLTASVSVQQVMGFTEVWFQVNDTGSEATGTVTTTVTLPAGSWLIMVLHSHHGADGWSCQRDSDGATCQHSAIPAGAHATGTVLVGAAGPACGQPVRLSAASGSASASAQSPQTIQCHHHH